jgi:hypothetical protein
VCPAHKKSFITKKYKSQKKKYPVSSVAHD